MNKEFGLINSHRVLKKSGYNINYPISIHEGGILDIEPGTEIIFSDRGRIECEGGNIIARGTSFKGKYSSWYINILDNKNKTIFENCIFCQSSAYNAVIFIENARVNISSCKIYDNKSAVWIKDSDVIITDNEIYNNSQNPDMNGAIRITQTMHSRCDCVMQSNNIHDNNCLGISLFGDSPDNFTARIENNKIENNKTDSWKSGGGVCITKCSPMFEKNILRNNFGGEGGGIRIYESAGIYRNNRIENNKAYKGGGFFIDNTYDIACQIFRNEIVRNEAIERSNYQGEGGGIYIDASNAIIEQNKITSNIAREGGGVFYYNYMKGVKKTVIRNNTISENLSRGKSGGIFINNEEGLEIGSNEMYNNSGSNVARRF